MFTLFTKKKAKESTTRKEIRGYIVPKTMMIKKFKPKKFEPKKFEPEKEYFEIKYRDTKTGEVFTINLYDNEAYETMMSNRHAQILFKE